MLNIDWRTQIVENQFGSRNRYKIHIVTTSHTAKKTQRWSRHTVRKTRNPYCFAYILHLILSHSTPSAPVLYIRYTLVFRKETDTHRAPFRSPTSMFRSNGFCFIPCARHTQPMWQIVNPIFGSRYKIEDEIQRNNTDTIDSFVQSRNQWFLQSQSKLCMLSGFLQCLSSSPPSRIKTQILPSKSR